MMQKSEHKTTRNDRLMTVHEVADRLGYSASSIWRLESAGLIPSKVDLAGGRVAWFESHIDAWFEAKRAEAENRYAGKKANAGNRAATASTG